MTAKQNDIEAIYSAALAKSDEAERDAYLDAVCGDAATRTRVEALLEAHRRAGQYLESPPPFVDAPPLEDIPTEGAGTVIDRYKLLEKIGEGGMAVVYLAGQKKPIRRKVALKVIKVGMDTKEVIARFEAERQALALMDHPHIAKVLDAGATETGRPYFVMELVSGVSITEFCDANQQTTGARLDLFLSVCEAVQHAHQKGIIHRDIKPSNVMVTLRDGKAIPKVIDFGIAKATQQRLTEKTLFTRYAHIIGTPAYMSPEQAELSDVEIDARSDIYSLGVLLYELLTGMTPFGEERLHKEGYLEMQRVIREEEPTKPSTKLRGLGSTLTEVAARRRCTPNLLHRAIRGDLDWIVMKSLEKDRERRYETAQDFARDIERHLSHKPVSAGPPTTIYRIGKFTRRHRAAVVAVALVAASLTIGASTARFFGFTFGHSVPQHAQGMVQRHVWNVPALSNFTGGLSQDGRYLPYIDWTAGNLAIRDLQSETQWLVTNNTDATWKTIDGWAETAVMAPDGSRVAYAWVLNDGLDTYELRSAGRDGSDVHVLYQNAAVFWIGVYAWSPDNRHILIFCTDARETSPGEPRQSGSTGHLVLISSSDGAVRILQTWDRPRGMPLHATFSPDGRTVAYDLHQGDDSNSRDIYLLDLETHIETPLIEHPADDRLVGWTPDGRDVLFASDRGPQTSLWLMAVEAGAPGDGPPRKLVARFDGDPVGFAADGAFYYGAATTTSNVYLASLDDTGLQFEAAPILATTHFVGSAMMGDWSPDGQWLAYRSDLSGRRSSARGGGEWAVVLYSLETGRERLLTAATDFQPDTRMRGPWWSPKGDVILVSGVSSATGRGLHTIDVESGQVTQVKAEPNDVIFDAAWSADGASIYYLVGDRGLRRVELATGQTTTLFASNVGNYLDLSPDGQWLAFWSGTAYTVMPSTGGEPRDVIQPRHPNRSSTSIDFVAWTPDGEYLLYSDGDELRKVHVETGQRQQIGPDMPYLIDVALHPDGRQMALTMEQKGSELWVMENFLPE